MIDEERAEPGPPIEPVSGDKRTMRQECPECRKVVGNLPSHLAQKHGIRGENEGRSPKRDRPPRQSAGVGGSVLPIRIQMQAIYELFGTMVQMRDPHCGGVIMRMAPMLGAQWEQACKSNPALERMLNSLAGGGAIVTLVGAHVPLAVAVIQHHGPAARAQREAEEAAWREQMEAAAANGQMPEGWIPPGSVPPDEAYGPGPYVPGSADAAR